MRAPEQFAYAYSGLEVILADLGSGGIPEAELRREAFRWMREDARGSLAMCKAAIFAMRHEAAAGGLAGDAEAAVATVRALGVIERALAPADEGGSPTAAAITPTPARVPDALRKQAPEARVFRMGKAQILAEPGAAGWHVSISHPDRFPSIPELMAARDVTGATDRTFAALLPPTAAGAGRSFLVHIVEASTGSNTEGAAGGTGGLGA